MQSCLAFTQRLLESAFATLLDNLKGLTLEEALFVLPDGYRSVLGTIKHAAGWSHVYHVYHAGEINQLLSIYRQEAWEEGEEVEENHVSSEGHRVVPPWKQAAA